MSPTKTDAIIDIEHSFVASRSRTGYNKSESKRIAKFPAHESNGNLRGARAMVP
jgi:hypothetical protein